MVEVMIAVAVLGVLFFALYSGITAGFTIIQLARENLRATQILQEKMETIRLYNWDQVNSNGFIPTWFRAPFFGATLSDTNGLQYSGTMVITNAPVLEPYSNDLRLVTVQVQWTNGNQLRTRSMSTLVSRYGLQNYIY